MVMWFPKAMPMPPWPDTVQIAKDRIDAEREAEVRSTTEYRILIYRGKAIRWARNWVVSAQTPSLDERDAQALESMAKQLVGEVRTIRSRIAASPVDKLQVGTK